MIDNILIAFQQTFTLQVFFIIIIGSFIGIIFGVIPGLTYSMALSLMLPFTFGMGPINAITLLVSVFIGGASGGSISAILIGVPGTPSAAATVFDGYPMTKQGKAGLAMGITVLVSTIGGLLSLVAMILMTDFLAKFAIKFGPAEIFALVLFGFSTICGLADNALFRGLAAGIFGLMLMTVGIDDVEGVQRFTFGRIEMLQGINLLVAMIGLFAVPHVIEVFHSRMNNEDKKSFNINVSKLKTNFPDLKFYKKYLGLILRCTGLGTIIGIIPGAGGTIAAFLGYTHAKNSEKDPIEKAKFGKGNIGGVVGPETANNAITGGAMIPLLALGIPGDPATAIMLGALLIHGIVPGPMLFVQNAPVVYSIYIVFFVAYVVVFFMQVQFIKQIVKCLAVKPHNMAIGITIMIVIGAYTVRNSFFDVYVMFIIGFLGYFLNRINVPLAPIVLGMVLGEVIESNYRTSMALSSGSFKIFASSPISLAFIFLIFLTIGLQIKKRSKDIKQQKMSLKN
jgi:putative tricarboxylic transport membrane protein